MTSQHPESLLRTPVNANANATADGTSPLTVGGCRTPVRRQVTKVRKLKDSPGSLVSFPACVLVPYNCCSFLCFS